MIINDNELFRLISEDNYLFEIDLSFNMLGIHGAEDISNVCNFFINLFINLLSNFRHLK